jgi:SMC interacting uncharacterized protein involved in chromosome segregation
MASVKNLQDLVVKLSRINKDRAMVADLLELSRMLKGLETDWNTNTAKLTILANDIVKLKKEIVALKSQAQPADAPKPAEGTGPRTAEGFVWNKKN